MYSYLHCTTVTKRDLAGYDDMWLASYILENLPSIATHTREINPVAC